MTKIKICGLSRSQDIQAVNEALPDYIGFVFAKSHRQVSFKQAEKLKSLLDSRILAVGVFVNASHGEIASICKDNIIDIIQLHGDEDENYITELRNMITNPIIKANGIIFGSINLILLVVLKKMKEGKEKKNEELQECVIN